MLLALLGVIAAAPIYWFLVPGNARKDYLAAASIVALGLYDIRLPIVTLSLTLLLFAATRLIARTNRTNGRSIMLLGFVLLLVLFWYNKLAVRGEQIGVVATQGGLVFLGMSYFVLKAAAILIEAVRGTLDRPSFLNLVRWMVFLPIFPSGPIEEFKHFDAQEPTPDRERILEGFERILFGCVRALVFSHFLAAWATAILTSPAGHTPFTLLLAAHAFTLRFYFDFAGYSDIAIGLAAIYGYRIQENFDNPLIRRNIGALWKRWHMTLTGWMRLYLFIPLTHGIMRRGGRRWDGWAVVAGQLWSMLFCGLWHGLRWEYALWGVLHALGLVWISLGARRVGNRLPPRVVGWWRRSPVSYGISWFLTVSFFSLVNVLVMVEMHTAMDFFAHLIGLR